MIQLSATLTLYVTSQCFFVVVVVSLSTQSGNFWINPHTSDMTCIYFNVIVIINYTKIQWFWIPIIVQFSTFESR
jgi:hypothetical protein